MSIARKLLMGSSGGAKKVYSDEVFSTYIYKGTGSSQTITNNIDISGEGGMVWTKSRSKTDGGAAAFSHIIHDSIRGASYSLSTDNNNQSNTGWAGANTLTSTGYSIAGGDATNGSTTDARYFYHSTPEPYQGAASPSAVSTLTDSGNNGTKKFRHQSNQVSSRFH